MFYGQLKTAGYFDTGSKVQPKAMPTYVPESLRGKLHTPAGQEYLRNYGVDPDEYDWEAYRKMHEDPGYQKRWSNQK